MRIFLTGATGNVGEAVGPVLLDQGHSLAVLVREPREIRGCSVVGGAIERIDRVAGEIAACDAIVHLARPRHADPSVAQDQDISGTGGLIEAWRKGVFLYASSSSVYGYAFRVLDERTRVAVWSPRALSKYANEMQLRFAERTGGRGGAVILRPALILTTNPVRRRPHLLAAVYDKCRRGSRFVFESEQGLGAYGCTFIGGADFGRAVAAALTLDLSGIYNIGGGFFTWRELVETFNRVAGTKADCVVKAGGRLQAGEYQLPQSRSELDTAPFTKATSFAAQESITELVEAFVRAERTSAPA